MNFLRLFTGNLGWKITSVVIAAMLWAAVRWDMIEESSKQSLGAGPLATFAYQEVPIVVYKKASVTNRIVLEPSAVTVVVRGNSSLVEETSLSEIRVQVDLVALPGTNTFRAPLEVSVPEGLTVEFYEPRDVSVTVSR